MKQLFVIFASLICACGRGASPATQSASPATQASFPATQQVDLTSISSVKIWFYPWFLDIKPDGSAFIQYGSTFGDSATLPKGTCDFEVIVAEIIRQRFGGTGHADVSAGLVMKGVKSTTLSSLKDDAYFRKLIELVNDKWQDRGWRFEELRMKYPICPALSTSDPQSK